MVYSKSEHEFDPIVATDGNAVPHVPMEMDMVTVMSFSRVLNTVTKEIKRLNDINRRATNGCL